MRERSMGREREKESGSPFKLISEVLCPGRGVEAADKEDTRHDEQDGRAVQSSVLSTEGDGKRGVVDVVDVAQDEHTLNIVPAPVLDSASTVRGNVRDPIEMGDAEKRPWKYC